MLNEHGLECSEWIFAAVRFALEGVLSKDLSLAAQNPVNGKYTTSFHIFKQVSLPILIPRQGEIDSPIWGNFGG